MNKLFKFLVLIFVLEILLGYLLYFRSSTLETGHYISSIIKTGVKIKEKIQNKYSTKLIQNIEANDLNCKNILNKNIEFNTSGFKVGRDKIVFQTNLNFLDTFNQENDFLILVLGNSETYGVFIDEQNRLHFGIQKKLRNKISKFTTSNNKIKKGKIHVVNLSTIGGMAGDHLIELLNFTNIYQPDLAIFYTGGNEIDFYSIFSGVIQSEIYSTQYNNFIKITKSDIQNSTIERCLNETNFINNINFHQNNTIRDVDEHFKNIFFKIDETLSSKSIKYLFYIQPFDKPEHKDKIRMKNHKKIEKIVIENENFINLNLIKEDLELDFVDAFHTTNVEQISDIISNDIWKKYKDDIKKKIINQNN